MNRTPPVQNLAGSCEISPVNQVGELMSGGLSRRPIVPGTP
jgi:hypothetical protein